MEELGLSVSIEDNVLVAGQLTVRSKRVLSSSRKTVVLMNNSARLFLCTVGVLLLAGTGAALGQQETPVSSQRAPDSSKHPNQTPYATDRSVGYHILAAPAYLLHGVTRPIGWGFKYLEREFPTVFEARLPPRGFLPLFELGGPTRFTGGLMVYDNHILGTNHKVRAEGMFGSSDSFRGNLRYSVPSLAGPNTTVGLSLNFFSDPQNEFFLGGNDSDEDDGKAQFWRRQFDISTTSRHRQGPLTSHFELLYERVSADPSGDALGSWLSEARPTGLQDVELLTPRVALLFTRTRGRPRVHLGTEVFVQFDYTHDLTSRRFRYGRYVAEIRQYLPIGFFPKSRRLALRARLEQVYPLFDGEAVPFYQWPKLGGQHKLRGFRSNRFQERGALVLSAEYRYPIWSNLDAVIFADAGQVFPRMQAIAADRFHWSYGGGVHLLDRDGLNVRFEVAGSVEGARAVVTVEPAFRQLAR